MSNAIHTTAAEFNEALRFMKLITERRSTIPVLEMLRMKIAGGKLTYTATDLDRELTVTYPNEGKPASLLIKTHDTAALAKGSLGDVILEGKGEHVVGTIGSFNVRKPTVPVDTFPDLETKDTVVAAFTVRAGTLGWAMQYPAHAISTEETRYYLNGIFLHWDKLEDSEGLAAVATDGHQLVRCCINDDLKPLGKYKGPKDFPGSIIPRKTVHTLIDLLYGMDKDAMVTVKHHGSRIVIEGGHWRLVSKLIDGSFPDYHRVIPRIKDMKHSITTDAIALGTAAFAASKADKSLRVEARGSDLAISATSEDGDAVHELVEAEISKAIVFGINGNYLRNACDNTDGTIRIMLVDPSSPIRMSDPDQDDMLMMVMPMRASDAPAIEKVKALPAPTPQPLKDLAKTIEAQGEKKPAKKEKPVKVAPKKPAKAAKKKPAEKVPAKKKPTKIEAQATA